MSPTLVSEHLMGEFSPAFRDLSPVAIADSKATILQNLPESSAVVSGKPLKADNSNLLNSEMVWEGSQFVDEATYTRVLNDQEKAEVNAALKHFNDLGLDGNEVNCENFPLPTLGAHLRDLALEVHEGRGFVNIRGLDPTAYSHKENMLLFLGISSYIGETRGKQDDEGRIIAHLFDAKDSSTSQEERSDRHSSLALDFHNDMFANILALHTRACATHGGNHNLASAGKVYNELAVAKPALLDLMSRPIWGFETHGKLFERQTRPIIYQENGKFIMNVMTRPLLGIPGVPRSADLPEMTPGKLEALLAIQALAQKHKLCISLQPGDMTFVNNFAILHSRDSFVDSAHNNRYLVRLWLRNENLKWDLPDHLHVGNSRMFEDNHQVQPIWNIEPTPVLKFGIRQRMTP